MPNQREDVSFEGIGEEYATFKTDGTTITYDMTKPGGSAQVGFAVTMVNHKTVGLCADGDRVVGKLIKVESDGKANVHVEGFMALPGGASAALVEGLPIVGALGLASAKGYIRSATVPGASYVQAAVTDALKAKGEIIDNSTASAVIVDL